VKETLNRTEQRILLFSVFVLSLCGIIYELILGSLATYLLGNPIQQYSITIGVFLSSMGLGSYLSRFVVKNLIRNFVYIEVLLGLTGGLSVLVLNFLFSFSFTFYLLHVFFLIVIGTLVGLEIPLLTRILRQYGSLKEIISNVLTLDYIGGLAGSLFFPLVLFPFFGRYLAAVLVGIANISIAFLILARIEYTGKRKWDYALPLVSAGVLVFLAVNSSLVTGILQKKMFYDDIIFYKRSRYQEIVVTRNSADFRLYLDGSLQFSTTDEYRYHEMLVHPALTMVDKKKIDVLIMGGGDGLAVREVLKSSRVNSVTLVELDEEMINLARNNSTMNRINSGSLKDKRVSVKIGDAYTFLINTRRSYDLVIADFPDPHDESISKLYTDSFYHLVRKRLDSNGIFVTQSTSPLFARESFWCIEKTLSSVFKKVIPYHVFVPTFGDWGFNIASQGGAEVRNYNDSIDYRYFSGEAFAHSRFFPPDAGTVKTGVNTFNRPLLYLYYLKGWRNTDY